MRWWKRRRAAAERARTILEAMRHELQQARHEGEKLRIELALVKQARDRADHDAGYWRERAEKFIDQIGLKSAILVQPTMTPAPDTKPDSHIDTVFAALGTSEINTHKDSHPGAARAAVPVVTGVDAAVAGAAVKDLLDRVHST